MKAFVQIIRFLVGALFVYSGFVKLVDPIGSMYKFEEYFGADVLNLEFLIPYALPFSILLILAEIILGLILLLGCKAKLTTRLLFLLTLVFLFLTWYSWYYNKVTDCGCFGDAIKLTTWETFIKNVILIFLILLLVLKHKLIAPLFSKKFSLIAILGSLVLFFGIIYQVLTHLPIIDFRAFAVGKSIPEGMKYPENGEDAKIHDFYLYDANDADRTNEILTGDKVLLVVMYDLDKSHPENLGNIKAVTDNAIAKGYKVYGLSASYIDDLVVLKQQYQLNFDFLNGDGTMLKTIIRANPGIVTLSKGIVTGKWNAKDAKDVILR